MAFPSPLTKLAETKSSNDINTLIKTANKNDRFNLLEDDAVTCSNLTNTIHPLFHRLEDNKHMHLALQLASHFILHDRLLEFHVPLLYGREMHDLRSGTKYLCNPFSQASKPKKDQLLAGVRQALLCLTNHIEIIFVNQVEEHTYARTLSSDIKSPLTSSCCSRFQGKVAPKIEVSDKFLQFYSSVDGYAKASRCAQFRHDFLFATTLVHEVVHALGVMRRGNLIEPYYRFDYPETEWGYAWENFMFGCIINPQDKTSPGTHLFMRKTWSKASVAHANGGKEYCDVSMSWVGQWFRTETWNIIAQKGPTAIEPPMTRFKLQVSPKLNAWVVYASEPKVGEDMAELYTQWQLSQLESRKLHAGEKRSSSVTKIYYNHRTVAELQQSNVPVPPRICEMPKPTLTQALLLSLKPDICKTLPLQPAHKPPALATTVPAVTVHRQSSPCYVQRKRQADSDGDEGRLPKVAKVRA